MVAGRIQSAVATVHCCYPPLLSHSSTRAGLSYAVFFFFFRPCLMTTYCVTSSPMITAADRGCASAGTRNYCRGFPTPCRDVVRLRHTASGIVISHWVFPHSLSGWCRRFYRALGPVRPSLGSFPLPHGILWHCHSLLGSALLVGGLPRPIGLAVAMGSLPSGFS